MQYQGIDEQRIVNNGLIPIAKDLDMPLVVHQRRALPATRRSQAARHPAVHRHRQVGQRLTALKYHGDQFFLKSAAQMAEVFGDYPDAMKNTLLIAERCNVTIPSGENHLPNFAVPEGFTLDDYFEHVVRQGYAHRMERLRQLDADGNLRHSSRKTTNASPTKSR